MIERNMTDKQKNKIGISKMSEPNSRGRLLFLEHYLLDNTDDENPITAEQLIKAYEDNGYKAHRNTIRDDIAVLQASGMDIISGSSGKYKTFCVGSRLFEPAEAKTPHTAQQTIRFRQMYRDGICKVTDRLYTKTIHFFDINYQLAQNDDKTAIFENYCDFLNYFDSTIDIEWEKETE